MRRLLLLAALAMFLVPTRADAVDKAVLLVNGGANPEANNNLVGFFQTRGWQVFQSSSVPSNLSPYCCIWDIRHTTNLSSSDNTRYRSFLQLGQSMAVMGENLGFIPRNDSIEDFLRSLGDQDMQIDDLTHNPGTHSEQTNGTLPLSNSPNNVGSVTYNGTAVGQFEDLGRSTWATRIQGGTSAAALWQRNSLPNARPGQLYVALDINWLMQNFNTNERYLENLEELLCPTIVGGLELDIDEPSHNQTFQCPATIDVTGSAEALPEGCDVNDFTSFSRHDEAVVKLPTPGYRVLAVDEDEVVVSAPAGLLVTEGIPSPGVRGGFEQLRITAREAYARTDVTPLWEIVDLDAYHPWIQSSGGDLVAREGAPEGGLILFYDAATEQSLDLLRRQGLAPMQVRAVSVGGWPLTPPPPTSLLVEAHQSAPPEMLAAQPEIQSIKLSHNDGLFEDVDSVTPGLPDPGPVTWLERDLVLVTGDNRIQVRVRDDQGTLTEEVTVRLVDTEPPVIDCSGRTLSVNEDCEAEVTVPPSVSDTCDPNPALSSVPPLPHTFNGFGVFQIDWTAIDAAGNSSQCTEQVTILDLLPPILTCPANTSLELDPLCQATFVEMATATDNCDTPTLSSVPAIPATWSGVGSASVEYTAADTSGNTAICTTDVARVDLLEPLVTPPDPLTLECSSTSGVPQGDPDAQTWLASATASDNCDPVSVTHDAPANFPPGCVPGEITTVNFEAVDLSGNVGSAPSTLTVEDNTPPTLSVPPTLAMECDGPGGVPGSHPTILSWKAQATAADQCHATTLTDDIPALVPASCPANPLETSVTFTATDTCRHFTNDTSGIIVEDTTSPQLTVPPTGEVFECTEQGGTTSSTGPVAAWLAQASTSDTCHQASLTHNAPGLFPADCDPGQETVVDFTAEDACQNAVTEPSSAFVRDTTRPDLTVPVPRTIECSEPGGVSASAPEVQSWFGEAAATDICHDVDLDDDAPAFFPSACDPGQATTVRFTATDECALSREDTSVLTVVDSTAPALTVPDPIIIECTEPGGVSIGDPRIQAWLAQASADDACSTPSLVHDAPAFFPSACDDGHTTEVSFTATDDCGLTTTLTSSVTVVDTEPPAVTVPDPIIIECTEPGGVSIGDPRIQAWLAQASASDACGSATLTSNAPPLFPSGCLPGQTTVVTFIATDDCGNVASLSSSVTVVDTMPPLLTVPDPITIECSDPGGVLVTDPRIQAWLAQATASDACGSVTLTENAPPLFPAGCPPGQTTVVTFIATDDCGNVTSLTSSVTVVDTTPPDLEGCGLVPWDPLVNAPRPPRSASSPLSCVSSGSFKVECGEAGDLCDSQPVTISAEFLTQWYVVIDGECVLQEELIPVDCDEVLELRALPPPCPAKQPRSAHQPLSVGSGNKVISAEAFLLLVTAADGCDNLSEPCEVDPFEQEDPTNPPLPLLCPPEPPKCPTSPCGVP